MTAGAGRSRLNHAPLRASQLLHAHNNGLQARIAAVRRLQAAWRSAIAADVADRCFPLRVDAGALVLGVTEDVWITELHMRAGEILAALRNQLPDLTAQRVRFEHVERWRRPRQPSRRLTADHDPPRVPRDAVERIRDPRLREAYRKLAGSDGDE